MSPFSVTLFDIDDINDLQILIFRRQALTLTSLPF